MLCQHEVTRCTIESIVAEIETRALLHCWARKAAQCGYNKSCEKREENSFVIKDRERAHHLTKADAPLATAPAFAISGLSLTYREYICVYSGEKKNWNERAGSVAALNPRAAANSETFLLKMKNVFLDLRMSRDI